MITIRAQATTPAPIEQMLGRADCKRSPLHVSPLARAALEAGVAVEDVAAYSSRGADLTERLAECIQGGE